VTFADQANFIELLSTTVEEQLKISLTIIAIPGAA
jgi:hypothetical protein